MKEKPSRNSGGVGRFEDFGKSENFRDSNNSEGSGRLRGFRKVRGVRENRGIRKIGENRYTWKRIENLLEPRRTPGIRSLGDSDDGEIPKIGRLRNLRNRRIGENLFAWRKIKTSRNPVRFERKGNSESSGETGNFFC